MHCLHCTLVVVRSATGSDTGKISSNMRQPPPPRYISPPVVHPSLQPNGTAGYWTLPNRRPQDNGPTVPAMHQMQQERASNVRFNTIANVNSRGYPHVGYDSHTPSAATHGGYLKSSHQNTPQQHIRPARESAPYIQKHTTPLPASIPTVPRNNIRPNGMQSSTPTKKDGAGSRMMDMSVVLSPIQKNSISSPSRPLQNHRDAVKRIDPARLLSPPKSSMTAEELFVAIHKSKKKLNIKTDTDSYSRSASPSCSSMTSLSPGSSESSINGSRNGKPETGTLGVENVSRNRHSWSPNSNEVLDNKGYLDQRTLSPVPQAGSRLSWACDRLGPLQQTSMNDFKRLLLQHGPKSGLSNGAGSSSGRMSAAEQLRLSRQQKLTPPPPPSVPSVNGTYAPRSPAEKRTNGSKLLNSPRTLTTWRFASPRTDVLSSTILEDRAEEEKAANSPTQEGSEPVRSQSMPLSSHSHTLINSSVRRPLNLAFNESSKESPVRKEPLKPNDISAILQQYCRESSPKGRSELPPPDKYSAGEQAAYHSSSNRVVVPNNRTLSQDLLSPSNVKENVNTNRQAYGKVSATQMANYKARQLFLQQSSALNSQQPSSPRIQVTNYYNSHGSPGRSILASLETKSPSKSTLETAL